MLYCLKKVYKLYSIISDQFFQGRAKVALIFSMVAALKDQNFQQGPNKPPPPEHYNQPGPFVGQIEQIEMQQFAVNEGQEIHAASTFQSPHIYDEAGFQRQELLAVNEEPLYQNQDIEF